MSRESRDETVAPYRMELADAGWLIRNVRCAHACPVGTRSGLYISLLADGDFEEAYRYARLPNPFASACGRICAHPCEEACNRGYLDRPLAIRALKRFLTERHGVESRQAPHLAARIGLTPRPRASAQPVAIVGAGPAGLACAHDLALRGYSPVILEASPVSGGMLRLGVPEYRLPRPLLQREIDFIVSLGVGIEHNVRVGRDITLEELRRTHRAVFLACGAHVARSLPIEGKDLAGVHLGIEFLRDVNLGQPVELGSRVVVIGGGNVAFDVARAAIREAGAEGAEQGENAHLMLDVARAASFLGAEVHVVCLEPRDAMLADEEEVEAADEEGVTLHCGVGPRRIVGTAGKVAGLETLDVKSIFDDAGRFNPSFHEGSERLLPADTIIMAIGQGVDATFVGPGEGIELNPNGTIRVDPESLATTAEGVYAGGDAAFGPRIVINAIADGRTAAASIHRYLSGEAVPRRKLRYTAVHRRQYPVRGDYDRRPRTSLPLLPLEHRVGITEVEQCLDEADARREAGRCLRCFYNVLIDPDKCILCGRCAEACPTRCIRMVSLDRVRRDEGVRSYLEDTRPDLATASEGLGHLAMVQDERICMRCGQCVAACPADACTMMRIELGEGGVEPVVSPVHLEGRKEMLDD